MTSLRAAALALALLMAGLSPAAMSQDRQPPAARPTESAQQEAVIERLARGSVTVLDAAGRQVAALRRGDGPVETVTQGAIVEALRSTTPSAEQVEALWDALADDDSAGLATLAIVKALASATDTPRKREALWSELAELARAVKPRSAQSSRPLLGLFEQHRAELLALLPPLRETEGGGDEMAFLMTSSRVFGGDIWESLFDMVKRNPGAVARMIERERERGRPVKWEFQGFEGMMRWKDQHLVNGGVAAANSLEALDAAGETFITIFNALHSVDDWYRAQMLRGLGPVELFNAAVGGEQELYRLGTSGYHDFLHPIILKGIASSGSFEAFLEQTAPRWLGDAAAEVTSRRGLVFLRIASSFGLLDSVLAKVRDRDRFVADAIASLGDPRSFETVGSIVVDVLTGSSKSPQAQAFKRALLERLYGLYRVETHPARLSVYGSMLSVYQTVTGDRRDAAVDREFPLDPSMLSVPFGRLFAPAGQSGHVHRIFMRMHDDLDAVGTFASFRGQMQRLGASVRNERNFVVFRLGSPRRTVEIYANKPNQAGIRQGIADIGKALKGARVETVVGRCHTGIISHLQTDARRLLGNRISDVAAVIVGTCGGGASVRELIGTFGYVPFVSAKSTGRQVINNAIMEAYIATLLAMAPGDKLSMTVVLDRALARFLKDKANSELRDDARLYQVSNGTVLAARLFDTHVRRHLEPERHVAR